MQSNDSVQPTLASIQTQIFNRSCALPSGHSSAVQRENFVLEQSKSFTNLVNAQSANSNARAQNN